MTEAEFLARASRCGAIADQGGVIVYIDTPNFCVYYYTKQACVPMELKIDPFTPSEVADITGISLDNQRNFRRSGYLPKNSGHARFSLHDAARLLVIGLMAERGVGPKISITFADTAARGIVLSLLWQPQIYSKSAAIAAIRETESEVADAVDRVRNNMGTDFDEVESRRTFKQALAKERLSETVEAMLGMRGEARPSFFCLFANGHPEFFYGESHPWEDVDYSLPAWQGPVICFYMGALAALFASRMPRPVVHAAEEA